MDVSDEIVPLEESFQELDLSEQSHQPENEVKTQIKEAKVVKRKSLTCDTCPFKTLWKFSLERHQLVHDQLSKPKCTCGKKLSDKYDLKLHKRVFRTGMICDQCGKTFETRQGIRLHSLQKHQASYMYSCRVCGHQCSGLSHYQGHMNKHLNKRSKCKCGASFQYPSDYKSHTKI